MKKVTHILQFCLVWPAYLKYLKSIKSSFPGCPFKNGYIEVLRLYSRIIRLINMMSYEESYSRKRVQFGSQTL